MKKIIPMILLSLMILISGCVTDNGTAIEAPAEVQTQEVDEVTSATPNGEGWKISLYGVRDDEIWQSDFEAWKDSDAYVEMELEKKGETNLYGGILLKEVIAMVDDPSGGMPYLFQEDLWTEGYDITLTAADGYSSTFSTADVSPEDVLLVDTIDGAPASPQIAGNVTGKAWVRDLSEIEVGLAPVDLTQNNFEFILDINDQVSTYKISDLEAMEIYIEDIGSFTNSHGNTTDSHFGGVKLIPLLSEFMDFTVDSSITVIAMDGYEMTYGGDMLLDQADGEWILAFKENDEYMPEDPGYIRLVKVGPNNPNINGHSSARMIKKIVTEGTPFIDFQLELVQADMTEIFDRQTMQSGVVTNRNKVTYFDRRNEADIEYMGISLWRLLERPTGYKAITIVAADGFSITLDNSQVEGNDDVIIAMFTGTDEELLSEEEWPLKLVWDKDASIVPEGIKAIRNVIKIVLEY